MLKRLWRPTPAEPRAFSPAPPPRAPGTAILSDAWWQWLSAMARAREPRSRP
jgi:hypothetical protein